MQTLKRVIVLALGFILTASVCQAKLGETLDQCITRYGQPLPAKDHSPPAGMAGDTYTMFQKDGNYIGIIILNGVVAAEVFGKQDGTGYSDLERQTLLDADSSGQKWTANDAANGKTWARDDGAAAIYGTSPVPTLTIASKEYLAAQEAKNAANAK